MKTLKFVAEISYIRILVLTIELLLTMKFTIGLLLTMELLFNVKLIIITGFF